MIQCPPMLSHFTMGSCGLFTPQAEYHGFAAGQSELIGVLPRIRLPDLSHIPNDALTTCTTKFGLTAKFASGGEAPFALSPSNERIETMESRILRVACVF